jgi:hypothetical protein
MISKEDYINKKTYIKPEVTRVALDTSLVLMQVSNPNHHHTHTSSKGSEGVETPFASPFGDKPFN